jgi:hypothetical protein
MDEEDCSEWIDMLGCRVVEIMEVVPPDLAEMEGLYGTRRSRWTRYALCWVSQVFVYN